MTKTNLRRYFPGLTKNTFLLAATSFFADVSAEMLYPVMPIFLTTVIGAPVSVVGIVEGIAEGTQYTVQGFSGWLSDKIKHKKSIALFGYGLGAAAKPLIGMSGTWLEVLGARFLDRFGSATRSAPRDALIAASVGAPHRGRAFGLEGVGDNLGAVTGPLLAIFLIYTLNVTLRSIFFIALIPGLLALAMMLLVKESKATGDTKVDHLAITKKIDIRALPRSFWKYVLIIAIFGIGNSSNSFLILRAKNSGFSVEAAIFLYALLNLMAALFSYPAGSLSDKFGRKKLLLVAFGIFIITYLGFALSHSLILIGGLFVLYGGYQAIFRAVGKSAAADLVPTELRATGLGVFTATVGLTTLFASILAGQLWVLVDPSIVFIYGAVCATLASVTLLKIAPQKLNLQDTVLEGAAF